MPQFEHRSDSLIRERMVASRAAIFPSGSPLFPSGKTPALPRRAAVCLLLAAAILLYVLFQTQVHLFGRANRNAFGGVWSRNSAPKEAPLPADFRFLIKVLTYNRLESLSRCLESLAAADYRGDTVKLHILIDHFQIEEPVQHITIDKKLKEAHDLLHYVDGFDWPHGPKEVHYRTQNAGLQGQWLESWWPASNNEFAFVVEDDMRLSPLFYKYLRQMIATYYYEPSNYDPTVYGVSLQRPRFVPGKHGDPLQVDNSTRLFLYQLVGTWGQLLFPMPWKEFRIWYDVHRSKGIKPLLEGMVSTGWYHKSRERIWTPWFIKYVHGRGYFNLYTNFLNEQALSVSYREEGVNYKSKAGPDSKLIEHNGTPEINMWEMKPLKELKRYDYCFHEVFQDRLVATFRELKSVLPSLQVDGAVILVNTLGLPEVVVRNWLCQFSKLGIQNYLLLSQDEKLIKEFSQRGHAVMHIDLEENAADVHFLDTLDQENVNLMKLDLVTVQAIRWILRVGYSVWLTKADTLWAADPFHDINKYDADMLGISAGEEVLTRLLYIRSTVETLRLWKSVWKKILDRAKSSMSSETFQTKQDILGTSLQQCIAKGKAKLKLVSPSLIADISTVSTNQNGSSLSAPLLSGIQMSGSHISILKALGLWMLDDELACTGVFCKLNH